MKRRIDVWFVLSAILGAGFVVSVIRGEVSFWQLVIIAVIIGALSPFLWERKK